MISAMQEALKDEQSRDHSINNWKGILYNIKKLLE